MKEGWLKILKPVTLEIAIFREKNQYFEWKTTLTIIRRSRGKYSAIFTEPEVNNCFSIIFKGECEKLE